MRAKKTASKKKSTYVRRAPARRRKVNKSNVPEYASCSVVRSVSQQNGNQMYDYSTFQLADFPRAVQVARAYQYYRMTSVKVTWKPIYDTYIASTGGSLLKPQLYHMIDKGASIPTGITLEGLKNLGARPRAFDEKPISVTWAPAVLNATQSLIGTVTASYKTSPWLITNANPDSALWNASQIQHNGLMWYMETPGAVQRFDIDIEVNFQFKKALVDGTTGLAPALPLVYAVADASPDGIEGGSDGITVPLTR